MLTIEEQIERLVDAAIDQLDRNQAESESSATGAPESPRSVRPEGVAGADPGATWASEDAGHLDSRRTATLELGDVEPTIIQPTSRRRWPILVAAAAVVVLVAALVLVARDDASEPQVPVATPVVSAADYGLIAFSGTTGESRAESDTEIYVVAADGSGLRALTSTPGESEMAPVFSPDGTRLAFLRNARTGGGELVVIDPSTGVETFSAAIPVGPVSEVAPPAWSPDGDNIRVGGPNGGGDLNVDLYSGTWTTTIVDHGRFLGWSPDGSSFLFCICEGNDVDELAVQPLFLVPSYFLGTSDLNDVTNLPGVRQLPVRFGDQVTWAPDSSALAIKPWILTPTGWVPAGPIDVVTIADGQRRTMIADGFTPSWSPDGRHIAYLQCPGVRDNTDTVPATTTADLSRQPSATVWVAAADGTNARAVATSLIAPVWSPDSSVLLGVGDDGLFTVRPDGTGTTRLTPDMLPKTQGYVGRLRPCSDGPRWFGPVWQSVPSSTESAITDGPVTTAPPVITEPSQTVTMPPTLPVTPTA